MTNAIAPVGTAIAAMDRHGHRAFDGQHGHDEPAREVEDAAAVPHRAPAQPLPLLLPLPEDEPHAVMPGALFAATLIAQELPVSSAVLLPRLIAAHCWTPPQSSLSLKDAIA